MARNEKQGDKDSSAAAAINYFCSDNIASPAFSFVLSSSRPITPDNMAVIWLSVGMENLNFAFVF